MMPRTNQAIMDEKKQIDFDVDIDVDVAVHVFRAATQLASKMV